MGSTENRPKLDLVDFIARSIAVISGGLIFGGLFFYFSSQILIKTPIGISLIMQLNANDNTGLSGLFAGVALSILAFFVGSFIGGLLIWLFLKRFKWFLSYLAVH